MAIATFVFLTAFFAGFSTTAVIWAIEYRLQPSSTESRPSRSRPQRFFASGGLLPWLGAATLLLGLALLAPQSWVRNYWLEHRILVGVGVAYCGMMSGLLDDWICQRGRILILVPLAIAGAFLTSGLASGQIALFGWFAELGPLLLLIAFAWLICEACSRGWLGEIDEFSATCVVMLPAMICILAFRSGLHPW